MPCYFLQVFNLLYFNFDHIEPVLLFFYTESVLKALKLIYTLFFH